MKRTKQILSVLCAGAVLSGCMTTLPGRVLTAQAEEYVEDMGYIYGDLYYDYKPDGTLEITGSMMDITAVDIPSEIGGVPVTSIGDYAFCFRESLESVTIPDSVTFIGTEAFSASPLLAEIGIPESVIAFGDGVFQGTAWLEEQIAEDPLVVVNNVLIDGRTWNGISELPDTITAIAGFAFADNDSIVSVTIPERVKSIGSWAFSDCDLLTVMTIPDTVEELGSNLFNSCDMLSNVSLPSHITEIPEHTFMECISLTAFDIPAGVTSIGACAFWMCYNLTELDIPAGVDYVGEYAFRDTAWLDAQSGPLKIVNNILIDGTATVGHANIPDTVTSIAGGAFSGSPALMTVSIPDSVREIGSYAFADCEYLDHVDIPESVISLGAYAFQNCTSLVRASVLASIEFLPEQAFIGCTVLTAISLPDSLTYIGPSAFQSCTALTEITLPESVEVIDFFAFYDCTGLAEVTIPAGMAIIDSCAFEGCTGITDVYFGGTETRWQEILIGDYNEPILNAVIHFTEDPSTGTTLTTTTTTAEPLTTTTTATTTTFTTTTTTTITTTTTTTSSTTTTTAAQPESKEFQWDLDNWNFRNSSRYFTHGNYYISADYFNKLKENLTNTELYYVNQWKDGTWGGSCYGMSSLMVLANEGLLPYSDYTSGADSLYEMETPAQSSEIASLINYYQLLQVRSVTQQQYRTVPYRSHEENIQDIINKLLDGSPVIVGFKKSGWGGHAVLAYDVSYGSWTWNGVSYQGCIEICDPNYAMEYDSEACIYFNTSTYNWTIPCYSSQNVASAYGAVFNLVTDDIATINEGGYLSGTARTRTEGYIAQLSADSISDTHSIRKVERSGDAFFNQNTGADEIIADTFYYSSGESEGTFGYLLKDAQAGYRVSQDSALPMELLMEYENSILKASSAAGSEIIFDESGYISVSGESASYTIEMIFNEGSHVTDWYGLALSGGNSSHAVLEQTEEGYLLSGDNLQDITVRAYNDSVSPEVSFTTDYTAVLLYQIDENTIGVAADTDEDGSFETVLAEGSEPAAATGDVDGNGIIEISDATAALTIYARTAVSLPLDEFTEKQRMAADADKDGMVTIFDATAILTYYAQYAAGLNPTWENIIGA